MPRLKFFTTLNFAIQFFSFRFIYVDFETRRFERQFFFSSIFIVTYLVTLSSWCLRKLNFPERFDYSLKMIWRCDSKRMNMHKQSYRQKFNNRIRTVCEWERRRHPKEIVLSSRLSPYDFFLFFFSVTSFSLSGMVGFRLSPMMMTTFLFASHYQADDFKGIFFRVIAVPTEPISLYLSDSDTNNCFTASHAMRCADDAVALFSVKDCKLWQVNCINVQSFCLFPIHTNRIHNMPWLKSISASYERCVCTIFTVNDWVIAWYVNRNSTLTHSVIVLNDLVNFSSRRKVERF